nr:hypothetical protein [uncultured Arsenicibacter sp.]
MYTLLQLLLMALFVGPFASLLYNVRRHRAEWMDLYGVYDRAISRKAAWIFQKHALRHDRPLRWMRRKGYGRLIPYLQ